jgi:hypothetical protein
MGGWLCGAGLLLVVAQTEGAAQPPAQENAPAAPAQPGAPPARQMLPAQIDFRNDFERRFRVVELRALLDGVEIARRSANGDDGGLERALRLYDGPLPVGRHEIVIQAVLNMNNRGFFTYLDEYRVNVSANYEFTVSPEMDRVGVTMALQRRPGATVPPERQPVIVPEATTTLPAGARPVASPPR